MEIPAPLSRLIATSQLPLTLAERVGRETPLVAANDAFMRLTGYESSDLLGRDCRLLQGPRTQASARRNLRRAIDSDVEGQAVITNYRRNGEEFGNFVFLFPISTGGTVTHFLASQFEIAIKERTRAFERHGGFLISALAELDRELDDMADIEHSALLRLDRGALVRRRLDNWSERP